MTGLLEEALQRIEKLPAEQQDSIAAQILESLDDEAAWERNFQLNREQFQAMAGEAVKEHARGETRPLEELLGE